MKRTRFSRWPCSVARTVDLLGDWWTPLVLREAFYGARRFENFQSNLGIGRNILTQRLRRLVAEDVMRKKLYQRHPPRYEYRLTQKGRELFPVIATMMRWGDRWYFDGRPPVELRDRSSGCAVQALVVDENTGRRLDVRELFTSAGPSMPKKYLGDPRFRKPELDNE
ncbi:MAG: helix-turn-helix domain-containing protein [Myxococcota bacterium]